jgi:hypothetical protein
MELCVQKYPRDMCAQGITFSKNPSTYEVTMLKKLVALMTVLTASVFFTQSGVAAESHSFIKTENVKGKAKGLEQRKEKAQKKAQLQKKQQQRKNNKKNHN